MDIFTALELKFTIQIVLSKLLNSKETNLSELKIKRRTAKNYINLFSWRTNKLKFHRSCQRFPIVRWGREPLRSDTWLDRFSFIIAVVVLFECCFCIVNRVILVVISHE